MTYAFTQDVPIDAAFYQRIADGLGSEAPPGPVVHLAVERPEGGLRYTEVWELREDCDRFTEERLHPSCTNCSQRSSANTSPMNQRAPRCESCMFGARPWPAQPIDTHPKHGDRKSVV